MSDCKEKLRNLIETFEEKAEKSGECLRSSSSTDMINAHGHSKAAWEDAAELARKVLSDLE